MARRTIRPDGRKHQIPRCLFGFFGDLELKSGVESVGGGRFIPRDYMKEFNARIQFYDENSRTFRVRAQFRGFIAYFNVKVHPEAKEEIEGYINNYKLN